MNVSRQVFVGAAERFLAHLGARNRITHAVAERVRRVQAETFDRLAAVLLKLGVLGEEDLAEEMSAFSGAERMASDWSPSLADIERLPITGSFMRAHQVMPIAAGESEVTMACWDVLDEYAMRAVAFACEQPVRWLVARRSQIEQVLEAREQPVVEAISASVALDEDEIDRLKDLASEAPVIRLVQRVIDDAVLRRASDIHLEVSPAALHVRFRIDGLLRDAGLQPKELAGAIVSRIKVMAGLNIAERRLPQDGRVRVTVRGKEIDFRVATTPALHGESVVLRILDRQDVALDFDALGFDAGLKQLLRAGIARPHGIVLVTGPTGSGKTTTLYAALKEISTPDKKILTVEDPVEYVLEGVSQVAVKPQIGLTFAGALRSFLRQDPDVMMVGEIRDRETAEIAIQASLTGHLLLSTLHTNSAAAAITRLLDMGIDDYLLTSTLHLVLGQRLVRRLCERCRAPYEPSREERRRLGVTTDEAPVWYRPVGCPACQAGYRGRTTIIEALLMSDAARGAVLERCDAHRLEQTAIAQGMRTMAEHGLQRVNAGLTSIEEVLRVTSLG